MKLLYDSLREEFGKRSIADTPMPAYFATSLNPMMKLRPYQEDCFRYLFTYWENDFDAKERKAHLLFHMATGSGKTLIMAGAMLYLYEQGYRNFLFFVDSTNIIEKTKDNFLNTASAKYLFSQSINIGNKQVEIRLVDNFQGIDESENCINLCLNTIQGLHISLNTPRENAVTYDDFADHRVVLISDEAHHTNTATKKGRKTVVAPEQGSLFSDCDFESTEDWETTVMKIFHSNEANVLLEFTATEDFQDPSIAEKYVNKVIFDYPLKKFREDGYSKDISVVQSDLSPIDRAIQCVLMSQYKRKLFSSIHQDIKPVMMLKSKTIAENKRFYNDFVATIKWLSIEDIERIASNARGDMADVFSYIAERGIELENLLLEIKEDFKEENLLLVDGNNISPDKQLKLNSLESKDNEFRVVFAVDMLNEGWDVLNLFDIVRLYETRDSGRGKVGKTTMQEAQLIGRGARYMPFTEPTGELKIGERKFDNDTTNRLRALETLHYHSVSNSKYITELRQAMVQTGIVAEKEKIIELRLKESFKRTSLYNDGYVFINELEAYLLNEEITSIGEAILNKTYKVRIKSGDMSTSLVFESGTIANTSSIPYRTFSFGELGNHVVRAAINRFDAFKFSNLKDTYPNLTSIREFIESKSYLAGVDFQIFAKKETLNNLTQKEKLYSAIEVLRQIEPLLAKGGIGHKGTKRFHPRQIKDVFRNHTQKFATNNSSEKELGVSMKETTNMNLRMDLSNVDWHAYEDCFGTSEEKFLIKYIESIYSKLIEKYTDIYLLRNEKDLKIYSFTSGDAFEPDYVLFLKRTNDGGKTDYIQIFIEPKGEHLCTTDKWKEDALKQIRENADIHFSTQTTNFNVWGMPFFTKSKCQIFNEAMKKSLEISI